MPPHHKKCLHINMIKHLHIIKNASTYGKMPPHKYDKTPPHHKKCLHIIKNASTS